MPLQVFRIQGSPAAVQAEAAVPVLALPQVLPAVAGHGRPGHRTPAPFGPRDTARIRHVRHQAQL